MDLFDTYIDPGLKFIKKEAIQGMDAVCLSPPPPPPPHPHISATCMCLEHGVLMESILLHVHVGSLILQSSVRCAKCL